VEQLQEELRFKNEENQKLKEMLNTMRSSHTNLQMRYVSLMQQKQNQRTTEHEQVRA
jgi:hypothetical protein